MENALMIDGAKQKAGIGLNFMDLLPIMIPVFTCLKISQISKLLFIQQHQQSIID